MPVENLSSRVKAFRSAFFSAPNSNRWFHARLKGSSIDVSIEGLLVQAAPPANYIPNLSDMGYMIALDNNRPDLGFVLRAWEHDQLVLEAEWFDFDNLEIRTFIEGPWEQTLLSVGSGAKPTKRRRSSRHQS